MKTVRTKYFNDITKAHKVVELLKENGYKDASYTEFIDFRIGQKPTRYVHLAFNKEKGFFMSTTGSWIYGEDMKKVENEAKEVIRIIGEIDEIVNGGKE
jgi:hypothetical protein